MDWRFSTFLVALFAILFGFTWAAGDSGLCRAPNVVAATTDTTKDGAFNCFEYWFNRYQTLLAGTAALAAAGLTVALTRNQVRIAQRTVLQGQITAARAKYVVAVEAHAKISDFDVQIRDFIDVFDDIDEYFLGITKDEVEKATRQACRSIVKYAREVLVLTRACEAGGPSEMAAKNFLKFCQSAAEYQEVFEDFFPQFSFARDVSKSYYNGAELRRKIISLEEYGRLRVYISAAKNEGYELRQHAKALRDALDVSLAKQALQIVELEANLGSGVR